TTSSLRRSLPIAIPPRAGTRQRSAPDQYHDGSHRTRATAEKRRAVLLGFASANRRYHVAPSSARMAHKRWSFAQATGVFTIVRGRSRQSTRLVFQRAIMDGE